jgi:hypothetical protein
MDTHGTARRNTDGSSSNKNVAGAAAKIRAVAVAAAAEAAGRAQDRSGAERKRSSGEPRNRGTMQRTNLWSICVRGLSHLFVFVVFSFAFPVPLSVSPPPVALCPRGFPLSALPSRTQRAGGCGCGRAITQAAHHPGMPPSPSSLCPLSVPLSSVASAEAARRQAAARLRQLRDRTNHGTGQRGKGKRRRQGKQGKQRRSKDSIWRRSAVAPPHWVRSLDAKIKRLKRWGLEHRYHSNYKNTNFVRSFHLKRY